jgi:polyhydroxyalkanoate synthesis regulator phasin
MRTKKADRLAQTPKRKQMWVYTDKWVELHGRVQTLEKKVSDLETELKENLPKNELYPNK